MVGRKAFAKMEPYYWGMNSSTERVICIQTEYWHSILFKQIVTPENIFCSLRHNQRGRRLDKVFKWMVLKDNIYVLIRTSLDGIPQAEMNSKSLDQVMAWCKHATSHHLNKCWLNALTHICVTVSRRVNVLCVSGKNTNAHLWWTMAPADML